MIYTFYNILQIMVLTQRHVYKPYLFEKMWQFLAEHGIADIELRKQQLRLGILKASRVLLSRQEVLRQVLSQRIHPSLMPIQDTSEPSSDEDAPEPPSTILQQLMVAATQPSPLKPVFTKEELEVMIYMELICYSCVYIDTVCNRFYKFSIVPWVFKIWFPSPC